MRNAASTSFLEDLTRHACMPQPLGEWARAELEFGLHGTLNRVALAAALEGCCGIPAAHRETKGEPADRAHWLAATALEALHHWWPNAKRLDLRARLGEALGQGDAGWLLSCWCCWRATERAKRLAREAFIYSATETLAA